MFTDIDGGKEYVGNTDRSTKVTNYFDQGGLFTKYLRLTMKTDIGHPSMRIGAILTTATEFVFGKPRDWKFCGANISTSIERWKTGLLVKHVRHDDDLLHGLKVPEGKFCAALIGKGAWISQSFPQNDESFNVSFWAASRRGGDGNAQLEIFVDENLVFGPIRPPEFAFHQYTFEIHTDSDTSKGSVKLKFVNRNPQNSQSGSVIFLDNVQSVHGSATSFAPIEKYGDLFGPPAAVNVNLPLYDEVHISSTDVPKWGGVRASRTLFADNLVQGETTHDSDQYVSKTALCRNIDTHKIRWSNEIGIPCTSGTEIEIATEWSGTPAELTQMARRTMAFAYSGVKYDKTEMGTLISNADLRNRYQYSPCANGTIAAVYGEGGNARCRTLHGPFYGTSGGFNMTRTLKQLATDGVTVKVILRFFQVGLWRSNDQGYVYVQFGSLVNNTRHWGEEKRVWADSKNNSDDGIEGGQSGDCVGPWKEFDQGLFSTTDFSNMHTLMPQKALVTRCYRNVEETIPVPNNVDAIRVIVGSTFSSTSENNGFWGFDRFQITSQAADSTSALSNCPGQACPQECLFTPQSPSQAFYAHHCSSIEECKVKISQSPTSAMCKAALIKGSTCAPEPFQEPSSSFVANLECNLCNRPYSCSRNQPFPVSVFDDTVRANSGAPRDIKKMTLVIHGAMSFEAAAITDPENEATILLNDIVIGVARGTGTPGEFRCNSCDQATAVLAHFDGANISQYVYKTDFNGTGVNKLKIIPPKDKVWCISHVELEIESVPSPARITRIDSANDGTNIQQLNPSGNDLVKLIGQNLGPKINSVTYGKQGVGFLGMNCSTNPPLYKVLVCKTQPGLGSSLQWLVHANDQPGKLSKASVSYMNPEVQYASQLEVSTSGTEYVALNGTDLTSPSFEVTAYMEGTNQEIYCGQVFEENKLRVLPASMGTTSKSRALAVGVQYSFTAKEAPSVPYTIVVDGGSVEMQYAPPHLEAAYVTFDSNFKNAKLALVGESMCGASNCANFTFCSSKIPLGCMPLTRNPASTESSVSLHPGIQFSRKDLRTEVSFKVNFEYLDRTNIGDLLVPVQLLGTESLNGVLLVVENKTDSALIVSSSDTLGGVYQGGGKMLNIGNGSVGIKSISAEVNPVLETIHPHNFSTGDYIILHAVKNDADDDFVPLLEGVLFSITVSSATTCFLNSDSSFEALSAPAGQYGYAVRGVGSKYEDQVNGTKLLVDHHDFQTGDPAVVLGDCSPLYEEYQVKVVDQHHIELFSAIDVEMADAVAIERSCNMLVVSTDRPSMTISPSATTATDGIVTFSTLEPHSFKTGENVVLSGVDDPTSQVNFNGPFVIAQASNYTFNVTGPENITALSSGYSGAVNYVSFAFKSLGHSHTSAVISLPEANIYVRTSIVFNTSQCFTLTYPHPTSLSRLFQPLSINLTVFGASSNTISVYFRSPEIDALSASGLQTMRYPTAGAGDADGCCELVVIHLTQDIDKVRIKVGPSETTARELVAAGSDSVVVKFDVS